MLDRNLAAIRRFQVDGGEWRRHVEGNTVLFGQHRDRVGSNFVGDIAVGGDAISSHNDGIDLSLPHDRPCHIVRDERGGNMIFHQLPRCQTRALQERPSLVSKHLKLLPRINGSANYAQRRAVTTRRQCAGVAMGQDAAAGGKQYSAVLAHRFIGSDVFQQHTLGFLDHGLLDPGDRLGAEVFELGPHPPDGPEKVDGGGPRRGQHVRDARQVALQSFNILGLRVTNSESDTHRCRHADGRSAAHDHGADGIGNFFIGFTGDISLFRRQLRLVDEAHTGIRPFQSLDHVVGFMKYPKSRSLIG